MEPSEEISEHTKDPDPELEQHDYDEEYLMWYHSHEQGS